MFCKKGLLKNFAKYTGKHLRQCLFFNKVAGLGQVFFCEFCKFFKSSFFYKTPWVAAFKIYTPDVIYLTCVYNVRIWKSVSKIRFNSKSNLSSNLKFTLSLVYDSTPFLELYLESISEFYVVFEIALESNFRYKFV